MVSGVTGASSYFEGHRLDRADELIQAIRDKNISLIKAADFEELKSIVDEKGFTLLHHAIIWGFAPGVRMLIEAGLDVNKLANGVFTPFYYAASCDEDGEIIRLLLLSGVDRSAQIKALHDAALFRKITAITCLIEHDPSLAKEEEEGWYPIHRVIFSKENKAVELLAPLSKDLRTHSGKSPLHVAVEEGNESAVAALIRAGAKTDCKDNRGDTPLHVAISVRLLGAIGRLAPSSKDISNRAGEFPLHIAVKQRKKEIIEVLIRVGAKIDCKDASGRTPLYYAASLGYKEIVPLLVSGGADSSVLAEFKENAFRVEANDGHKNVSFSVFS